MKEYVEVRVKDIANYILNTGETIREVAKVFNVSKSTVHKDIHDRLIEVNPQLLKQVQVILNNNTELRHIHGGEATKQKYKGMKQ